MTGASTERLQLNDQGGAINVASQLIVSAIRRCNMERIARIAAHLAPVEVHQVVGMLVRCEMHHTIACPTLPTLARFARLAVPKLTR